MLTEVLGQVGEYAIKIIKKMQNEFIRSIVPKQDVTDAFNAHTQEFIKHTVWASNCRSWYKSMLVRVLKPAQRADNPLDNETGRVNAVYPGSSLHYIQVIEEPRYDALPGNYILPLIYCSDTRIIILLIRTNTIREYLLDSLNPK